MKTITTTIAAGAIAALLLPTLAFAHDENNEKRGKLGLALGVKTEVEREYEHKKEDKEHRKHASTTVQLNSAATVAEKAERIQDTADIMAAISTTVATKITNSDATNKAELQATLVEYNTGISQARIEASLAASAAAKVGSSTNTTTSASLLEGARTDLKEATAFLKEARKDLSFIFRSLWGASIGSFISLR